MSNIGYLNYPLNMNEIFKGKSLQKLSQRESIAKHLHLIITSQLGENLFEPTFGCSIWEYDFDNTVTDVRLRDLIKNSLVEAITNRELRIRGLEVKVVISQMEINGLRVLKRIKKRVDIQVKSRLLSTGEEFEYFEYFYLGPLSYC